MNLLDRSKRLAEVARRLRFAGAERGSRLLQSGLNLLCGRVCTTEHASGGPFRILERRHGLVEIVERGARGGERRCVIIPHPERESITLAENAARHGYPFAHNRSGFFEAP